MGIGDIVTEKKKQIDEWLKNQSVPVEIAAISAGSAVQGTRERDLFFSFHLFLAAMMIRLSLENQQPFPRSLSLSNALSLSSFVMNKQVACSASCSGR